MQACRNHEELSKHVPALLGTTIVRSIADLLHDEVAIEAIQLSSEPYQIDKSYSPPEKLNERMTTPPTEDSSELMERMRRQRSESYVPKQNEGQRKPCAELI